MNLFTKKHSQNVFVSFLDFLEVKHTRLFSNQYFSEHPDKNNFYGLSCMLSDYGIPNVGIKIKQKEVLNQIEPPVIAQISNDFAVLHKIESGTVSYLLRGKNLIVSNDEFVKRWSGAILVAEPDGNSVEPQYRRHLLEEIFKNTRSFLLVSVLFLVACLIYYDKKIFENFGASLLVLFNFIGLYISYLLELKHLKIENGAVDKLCTMLKEGDCNDVINSDAAKLFGIVSLSEIGISYFLANILLLLFVPQGASYVGVINVCALPVTLWSIWYQKFRVKKWCLLCLIVMSLIWCVFIVNITFGTFQVFPLRIQDLFLVVSLFLLPFLFVSQATSLFDTSRKTEEIKYEMNRFKFSEDVFLALLYKQPHYDINLSCSKITFGNQNAKTMITVLSNPHCEPCTRMHKRIDYLLDKFNGKVCVQYLFSSFYESLDISNKFLISAYFRYSQDEVREIFREWFEFGKYNNKEFFKKYPTEIDSEEVIHEFQSHNNWKLKTKLSATPTILINGYEIPDGYKIEDVFLLDL